MPIEASQTSGSRPCGKNKQRHKERLEKTEQAENKSAWNSGADAQAKARQLPEVQKTIRNAPSSSPGLFNAKANRLALSAVPWEGTPQIMIAPPLEKVYPDVTPIAGEHHSFEVRSRTGPTPYRVVLDVYNWNGWCGCQNFEFACQPDLERGAWPNEALRCWHIRRARAYYLDEIGRTMERQIKGSQAVCRVCRTAITKNGETWRHNNGSTKHPATP